MELGSRGELYRNTRVRSFGIETCAECSVESPARCRPMCVCFITPESIKQQKDQRAKGQWPSLLLF